MIVTQGIKRVQKSQHTRLQFSLKTLLAVMLLVASFFAGRIPEYWRAERLNKELYIAKEEADRMRPVYQQQLAISAKVARQKREEAELKRLEQEIRINAIEQFQMSN